MLNPSRTRLQRPAQIAAALLILINLPGCVLPIPSTSVAGATEATLCRVWGESLPTRSHGDTPQTQAEIGNSYADFAAACPEYVHLIP